MDSRRLSERTRQLPRYTRKARYFFEEDQYFLWRGYELEPLCDFLRGRCAAWID
jgi:hypothetical protein